MLVRPGNDGGGGSAGQHAIMVSFHPKFSRTREERGGRENSSEQFLLSFDVTRIMAVLVDDDGNMRKGNGVRSGVAAVVGRMKVQRLSACAFEPPLNGGKLWYASN